MSSPQGAVGLVTQGANGVGSAGFNFSLLKVSTIVQGLLGLFITTGVAVAAVGGITAAVAISTLTAPTPIDDFFKVPKHTWREFDVLVNDNSGTDNGAPISIVKFTQPTNGELVLSGKKLRYRANKYFAGDDSFTYKIKNDKLESNNFATVRIDVDNSPPSTVSFTEKVTRNKKTTIVLPIYKRINREDDTFNDNGKIITDADNDILTIESVTKSTHGVVEHNKEKGEIYYFTNVQGVDTDSIKYVITDKNDTSESTITLKIVNSPPVARPDTYTVHRNDYSYFDVLANDFDANGDGINITNVDDRGVLGSVVEEDRKITFRPDFFNKKTHSFVFSYEISDGLERSATTVTVKVENRPPVAEDISMTVKKALSGVVPPLNVSDPDLFETLKSTASVPSVGSWVSLQESSPQEQIGYVFVATEAKYEVYNYTWIYKAANRSYSEQIKYTVTDEGGASGEGVITVNVVNTAPVAKEIQAEAGRGQTITIALKPEDVSDENGDKVTLNKVFSTTSTNGGAVLVVEESGVKVINYTAPIDRALQKEDTFEYEVIDEDNVQNLTGKSIVRVNVVNTAPVANDDNFSTIKNINATIANLLENDIDVNNDELFINDVKVSDSKWTAPEPRISSDKKSVQIDTTGLIDEIYTLIYRVNDTQDVSNYATINVKINNAAPIAQPISKTVHFLDALKNGILIDFSGSISDPQGDKVSVVNPTTTTSDTTQGNKVVYTGDGDKVKVTFTNTATTSDSFTYTVEDDDASKPLRASSNVSIQLTNTAPVANGDSFSVHWRKGGLISGTALVNNDIDANNDTLSFDGLVTPSQHVSSTVQNGNIVLSRKDSYIGLDSLTYRVTDTRDSAVGTVSLTITNEAPLAPKVEIETHWKAVKVSKQIIDTLIKKDSPQNKDGDDVTIKSISGITSGTATISSDKKSIEFIPSGSFVGKITGTYTVTDTVEDAEGVLEITITNNNEPKPNDVSGTIHWIDVKNDGFSAEIGSSLVDADGDSLSYTTTSPDSSISTNNGKAIFKYQRTNNAKGPVRLQYTTSDGLKSVLSNVNINVINAVPTGSNVEVVYNWITHKDNGINIDLSPRMKDNDIQDKLSLTIVKTSADGTLNGKIINFKAPVDFQQGTGIIKYKVNDGLDDSPEYTITIEIPDGSANSLTKYFTHHWKLLQDGLELSLLDSTNFLNGAIDKPPTSGSLLGITDGAQNVTYNLTNIAADTDSFVLNYRNNAGDINNITVFLTITNTVPTAVTKTITNHWKELFETGKSIDLVSGSSDADSDSVSLLSVASPSEGTSTISESNVTYTLTSRNAKTDKFNYVLTDGRDSVSQTVDVVIENKPPVLSSKTFDVHWTERNTGKLLEVINEPTDNGGDLPIVENLEIVSITAASNSSAGLLTIEANKKSVKLKGSPTTSFLGSFFFDVTVSDGADTSTRKMTVNVVNTIPVAIDKTNSVHWRTAFESNYIISDALAGATDADSQDTSFNISSASSTLGVQINIDFDTTMTYKTSGNNKVHLEKSDIIKYRISDGIQDSLEKTITIRFTNDQPTGKDVTDEIHWRTSHKVYDFEFTDSNNDPLSYEISQTATRGQVSLEPNKNARYARTVTPIYPFINNGKHSIVDTFKVKAFDKPNKESFAEQTATITVYNNMPTFATPATPYEFFRNTQLTSPEKRTINVLAHADDIDASDKSRLVIENPSVAQGEGTVAIENNKLVYIAPNKDFIGLVSVSFFVSDGNLRKAASIKVKTSNRGPSCPGNNLGNKNKAELPQSGVNWNLASLGCSDPDGDVLQYSISGNGGAVKGTASLSSSSESGTLSYKRLPKRSGNDEVTITVSDGTSDTTTKFTLNIINLGPTTPSPLSFDKLRKATSVVHTFNGISGASDRDDDGIKLKTGTTECKNGQTVKGTVTMKSNNEVEFRPDSSKSGTCSFSYTIQDLDQDNTLESVGSVTFDLEDKPPVAKDDIILIKQSETTTNIAISSLLANDIDENGDGIQFVSSGCSEKTYCTENKLTRSGSNLVYTHDGIYCDEEEYKYTIRSSYNTALTSTAKINIRITDCICQVPIDLVFVVDGSGSISPADWTKMKDFLSKITERFIIGEHRTHVSFIQFSYNDRAYYGDYKVNNYGFLPSYASDVAEHIKTLRQVRSSTNTVSGLEAARKVIKEKGRRKIKKVIVLPTDGIANRPCSCSECNLLYKYYYGNQANGEAMCGRNSVPGFTGINIGKVCGNCAWTTSSYCMPCADPSKLAREMNSQTGEYKDYKVISLGITGANGGGLPSIGEAQIRAMNYDESRFLKVEWNQLDTIFQLIADQSCNRN